MGFVNTCVCDFCNRCLESDNNSVRPKTSCLELNRTRLAETNEEMFYRFIDDNEDFCRTHHFCNSKCLGNFMKRYHEY